MNTIQIRPLQPEDNPLIAQVIRDVLIEYDVPKVGTAYADPQLDRMYETYNNPQSVYYVLVNDGKIVGGAGIAPLQGGDPEVCELQKMYFLAEVRGKGFGSMMMDRCLTEAEQLGFKSCYLETMPYMDNAKKLYERSGFHFIDAPMGNTGHTSCPVWMLKAL